MVFKPNYSFQKAERDRAKQARKDEKAREKEEAKRRAEAGEAPAPTDVTADVATEPGDAA